MKTGKELAADVLAEIEMKQNQMIYKKRKAKKTGITVLCAVIVMLSLTVIGIAHKQLYPLFSEEWRNEVLSAALASTDTDIKEEFIKNMEKSDDPLVKFCLEAEAYMMLDEKPQVKMDKTISDGGYDFYFDRITAGKELVNKVVSGSIFHGDAEFKWTVEKKYYAVFEISRTDGEPLKDEDYEYLPGWYLYAEDYIPMSFIATMNQLCSVEYDEDYKRVFIIDITDLAAFAGRNLTIIPADYLILHSGDVFGLDENGKLIIDESVTSPHAVFNFTLSKKFADKKAVTEFNAEYPELILN